MRRIFAKSCLRGGAYIKRRIRRKNGRHGFRKPQVVGSSPTSGSKEVPWSGHMSAPRSCDSEVPDDHFDSHFDSHPGTHPIKKVSSARICPQRLSATQA